MSELTEELAALRKAIDLEPIVTTCPKCGASTDHIATTMRSLWHCWRCGEGGDVFAYLMRRDGISFAEAVEVARGMVP